MIHPGLFVQRSKLVIFLHIVMFEKDMDNDVILDE